MSCEREMSVWSMEMSTPKKVSDPPKQNFAIGVHRIYMYKNIHVYVTEVN